MGFLGETGAKGCWYFQWRGLKYNGEINGWLRDGGEDCTQLCRIYIYGYPDTYAESLFLNQQREQDGGGITSTFPATLILG